MSHVSGNKKALLARVRRVAGQVAALERALEEEAECGEVLVQMAAAKGAMHALMMEVLLGQLREHVVAESEPARREREARVLVRLLQSHLK